MSKPKNSHIVPQDELINWFIMSIEWAISLQQMAEKLYFKNNKKEIYWMVLALSEIALEEIGKSILLLQALCFKSDDEISWKFFWDSFYNHNIKAMRAHQYEWFCSLRICLDPKNEQVFSLKNKIPQEKEIGLYIDYDKTKKSFYSPHNIEEKFIIQRLPATFSLLNIAEVISYYLAIDNKYYYYFWELLNDIWNKEVYQQDMDQYLQYRSKLDKWMWKFIKGLKHQIQLYKDLVKKH